MWLLAGALSISRDRRVIRAGLGVLLATVGALGIAVPAGTPVVRAATDELGSRVQCRYEITAEGRYGWTEADLRRIKVTPPTMFALRSRQKVGWRFVVQRSIDGAPWQVTYRSPIPKATAYSDQAASFSPMSVPVAVPSIPPGADYDAWDITYRVVLRAFWYRSDGSTELSKRHVMENYRIIVGGNFEYVDEFCRAEVRQFFDGPG